MLGQKNYCYVAIHTTVTDWQCCLSRPPDPLLSLPIASFSASFSTSSLLASFPMFFAHGNLSPPHPRLGDCSYLLTTEVDCFPSYCVLQALLWDSCSGLCRRQATSCNIRRSSLLLPSSSSSCLPSSLSLATLCTRYWTRLNFSNLHSLIPRPPLGVLRGFWVRDHRQEPCFLPTAPPLSPISLIPLFRLNFDLTNPTTVSYRATSSRTWVPFYCLQLLGRLSPLALLGEDCWLCQR